MSFYIEDTEIKQAVDYANQINLYSEDAENNSFSNVYSSPTILAPLYANRSFSGTFSLTNNTITLFSVTTIGIYSLFIIGTSNQADSPILKTHFALKGSNTIIFSTADDVSSNNFTLANVNNSITIASRLIGTWPCKFYLTLMFS